MLRRRDPSPPPHPRDRTHLLEERLSIQERTTAFLLQQAFQIKDDILSYLQGTKSDQHGETSARRLLENQVQAITSILKKLSQDIEVLERQIRTRDGAAAETNFAVQSLDYKFIQSLGDLRGRVARCEASMAKLSADISTTKHEAQKTDKQIYGLHSALKSCATEFEKKVLQLLGKIETSNSDQSSNLKTVQGDQHHEMQLLDFKLRRALSDFRDHLQTHQKWTEAELARAKEEQAQQRQQLLELVKERVALKEKNNHYKKKRTVINFNPLLGCLLMSQHCWRNVKNSESGSYCNLQTGFQSIRESLDLLRQIQNTRIKLEKKKIEKDLHKIESK
ncbi:protein FAM81B [Heliangelus exortis]|uniref:protein FAM81B n=1 Tax=Heliangelus exortis TaxID=472823 RepID=UPI003A916488